MIRTCDVIDLPDHYYDQCWRYNRGSWGQMRTELVRARELPEDYDVAEVWLSTHYRELRAWALVFQRSYDPWPHVYVFTRPAYRRQGHGRALMHGITGTYAHVLVYPWDRRSTKFLNAYTAGAAASAVDAEYY